MTNFDDFKQMAKDTMETIADKSIELYKIAEEKAKIVAKATKLSTEIALEKGTIRKLYREIGKKYYELHKSDPESDLSQMCTEITTAFELISVKHKEIDNLKAAFDLGENDIDTEKDEDDIDVEVEVVYADSTETKNEPGDAEHEDSDENTAEAEGTKH